MLHSIVGVVMVVVIIISVIIIFTNHKKWDEEGWYMRLCFFSESSGSVIARYREQ